jgi:hypothetical protein
LHSKKREMLEQPAESARIAFRIAGASDGVIREANAEDAPEQPVGDGMAAEIK